MEKGSEQSPEIFACSTATGKSSVRRSVAHVQLRGPQRRGEVAGHVVVPPASTIVATNGGVQGMVMEAVPVGDSGEGRRGLGHELRFHRLS
jgi:hypothetical protein